ncbi:MAG: helix-turn-helix domain-containing protein [Flavobacteriales bacterium]|nr:helix-turn-helix domain-containing protein [Flavobacteriales bacterium]
MPETNINWILLKDEKVVEQLGKELRRMRLSKNMSQADVAKNAGLDRTTVVKLEAGRSATLLTVVQILRAMDRLDVLDGFHEEPQLTPYQVVEQQEKYLAKQRKRASPIKYTIVPPKPKSTW